MLQSVFKNKVKKDKFIWIVNKFKLMDNILINFYKMIFGVKWIKFKKF